MSARSFVLPVLVVTIALAASPCAHAAIVVDGQLDAEYGTPTIVQTLQTGLSSGGTIPGDNTLADLNYASGSELDAAYALVTDGVLRLFLSGNLALRLNMQQNGTRGHILDVFVDSAPAGQNQLNGIGAGNPMNGMTFDAGFEPDYYFELFGDGNQFSTTWYAGRGVLESPGGGTFTSLGSGSGGWARHAGGRNESVRRQGDDRQPQRRGRDARLRRLVRRRRHAAASSGRSRSPAIGSPEGCFRLSVIVRDGSNVSSPVSNSVLAPAPAGTCPPGPAQFVNFASIAGSQTFDVCPSLIGVPRPGAATLALAFPAANPARGDRLLFRYALPEGSSGTLTLHDVAGRVVRRASVAGPGGQIDLSQGGRLAPGLYWARLVQGGDKIVRGICIVEGR
jgi:hypothetical protein